MKTIEDLKELLDKLDPKSLIVNNFIYVSGKETIQGFTHIKDLKQIKIKKHMEKDYYVESESGEVAYNIE